ncbi:hypothetical protein [Paenibacillus apiarius]|uniref:hypothetical protein n=1 Tax=Paenibacillus apiarius TaxID=46240 RepID=UPI00198142EF|nr:hypothetical protein [Paenibacillus apiarius]MBN3523411.1 hypothetical protein [Paenibacillus apiarius]
MLFETPEAFIDQLAPHIIAVHISDYDGQDEKHWMPGAGINNWHDLQQRYLRYKGADRES